MHRLLTSTALLACSLYLCAAAHAAPNLLDAGAMESPRAQELPAGWEPLVIGAPAKIEADTTEKHGGQSSVRIDAAEVTRSYVRSTTPIEVAPGEAIEASAWVKLRGALPDKGVIVIAEFADAAGAHLDVEKFTTLTAKSGDSDWKQIKGSVTVPPNAARLHLRLGFSYSKGTAWWDDVTVTARQPLVCRIDLPDRRLSPAMSTLPVTVLNRDGGKKPVVVKLTANKQSTSAKQTLSGKRFERVQVPLGTLKPGDVALEASLTEGSGGSAKPVFVDEAKATVPPPLTLGVPSPTHWAIDDGQRATVEGLIDVAVPDDVRRGATLTIRVVDTAGNLRGQWVPGGGGPQDGRSDFELKAARLAEGEHKLVATLTPKNGGKPIEVEQPWHVIRREQARVTLNSRGFPEYEGKAIFPLGIFNGAKFKEQAEAGFTVTHAYNAVRIETSDLIAADRRALAFANSTQQHGMKALFMVPMKLAIAGDFDGVRRRVRMFRNHPALLAWDEEEGFARGDFKPDTLKRLRQIIQEEDPHHPFMVGDSRDVITRIAPDRANFFPVDEMDLGMWWWYPFPLKAQGSGDALLGEDAGPAGLELAPPSFLVNAKTRKPLWVGVQSYKKPGEGNRYPTPAEYRAQAYLAIVHGAKGLMWYGGSVTGGLFLAPDEGHWPELKQLVRELRGRSDVFMSPSDAPPSIEPAGAPVSAVVKRTAKGKVLIAVNRSGVPLDVTIGGKRVALDGFQVLVATD